jgi:outer membrane protein TolC
MSDLGMKCAGLALALAATSLTATERAPAQDAQGALTSQSAVELAVQNNPTLHLALLQVQQARYAVTAEEALYDAIFDAGASVNHDLSPSLRGADGTIVSTVDTVNLSAELTKTFSFGTVVQGQLTGQRRLSSTPQINMLGGAGAVGPAYALNGTLSITQPFLRGAWNTVGQASLRQARINRTAQALAAQQAGSQVLHDVLTAYWELWYSMETVRIDQASRDLAKILQEQADEQVRSGTLANVDALIYRTQVAQQEGSLVAAATDVRQRALTLALELGQAERQGPDLSSADSPPDPTPDEIGEGAIAEALAASYELKQLQAQLKIAQDQATIAGDALRPQLNLNATLSSQGLGNREVSPAFDQFGRLQAWGAQVGLSFETPVTDTRRSAQVQGALLSAHIAEKQIEVARQQLRTDVRSALARRDAAKRRLELALITEKVARDQADGQRGKFQAGTALAIEVQQADNADQQAQLSTQRARVDVVEGELDLLHLRGKLLERYADVLKSYKPTAQILNGANDPL